MHVRLHLLQLVKFVFVSLVAVQTVINQWAKSWANINNSKSRFG